MLEGESNVSGHEAAADAKYKDSESGKKRMPIF